MKSFFTTFFLATMATTSFAHMEMSDPPPLRSKFNKLATNPDYSMTSPLPASGSDSACKGFLSDLGTAAGGSVATWAAGSEQKFTIVGGAAHNGGSCQASLSYDSGKTFKAIHSYIGNCPLVPDYKFTVPADAKAGPAVFAWTWFNKVGNREMYMNCASVTITAGSGTAAVAFSARPDMFVANTGTGCTTLESSDLLFPNPGPDVTKDSAGTAAPVGSCATGSGSGSGSGTGSGSGNTGASASVVTSQAPTGFTTSIIPSSTNTAQSGSSNPKTPTSPLTPSTNGECGGPQTCAGSSFGQCCSKYGYCGVTAAHCGEGCDPTLGTCGSSATGAAGTAAVVSSGAAKATAKTFLAVSNAVAGVKSPGGPLTVSADGVCGGSVTCAGSTFGQCCSQYGYCGVSSDYCGQGCNPAFGTCGASGTGPVGTGPVRTGPVGTAPLAAMATGKSLAAVANAGAAGTKSEAGEMVTKTETEVVYSTVYVNDVGGRSTFQTVTRAETVPRGGITVIPVVQR